MLSMRDVHASYGPVLALRGVSLDVPDRGVVSVLGPNGAGKSSTLRAISGIVRPAHAGHPHCCIVEFDGRRVDRMSPEQIVRLGISQVPEGRQIFAELTVLENLRLGAYTRGDGAGVRRDLERVLSYFPVLGERRRLEAGLLSGGEQQMLAIGRALMAKPKLLLLDEPSLGLAPLLVREIFKIIKAINVEEGLAVLLVEQDANLALDIAQHGYLLEVGRVVLDDEAAHLRQNEAVRRSYLGY
jgi:branched-chain amino acid transport system ATP-binding protein